ncbi:hypothetical protein ABFA07_013722 [Porites harrisoni]
MKVKRSVLLTKRFLFLLAGLVGVTVLLQCSIFVLLSIYKIAGSCCFKIDEGTIRNQAKLKTTQVDGTYVDPLVNVHRSPNDSVLKTTLETISENITAKSLTCRVPESSLFPLCSMKIKSFNESWNPKCHGVKHHVQPNSLCSVIEYLSEVEGWCPVLPSRRDFDPFKPAANHTEAVICTDVSGLLEKLKDDRYAWMRIRITETWPQWKEATEQLAATLNVKNRMKKKILLYMGSIEDNFKFFTEAFTGGCLGELTQWSDLMSALYILGHDLIIRSDYNYLRNIITQTDSDGCALRELADGLDLIFTDIPGAKKIMMVSGPHSSRYRCKMRILDSFGTDAEFNYPYYKESIPGGRSVWGDVNLLLPQFMTMFPHSPDNSFLGFAVPKKHRSKTREPKNRTNALIYGKLPHFWKGKSRYIEVIRNHVQEVHANIGSKNETVLRKFDVPDYVINHGIVNISTLMDLFQGSKVFVGLGDPLEGPAALEALANGCFFLNPKFDPPFDRVNHGFYAGKPMNRKITSQNPYAEVFVGEPFVQTVNINNMKEVEKALQKILNSSETPRLPYEFTVAGMLERLNAYLENQDFCKPSDWPPIKELQITKGKDGQSCEFACLDKGLVCEPTFFATVNSQEMFKRAGIQCHTSSIVSRDSILAPSLNTSNNTCFLQGNSMLFSCRAARPGVIRVCPCRSYRKEQVALCESC